MPSAFAASPARRADGDERLEVGRRPLPRERPDRLGKAGHDPGAGGNGAEREVAAQALSTPAVDHRREDRLFRRVRRFGADYAKTRHAV